MKTIHIPHPKKHRLLLLALVTSTLVISAFMPLLSTAPEPAADIDLWVSDAPRITPPVLTDPQEFEAFFDPLVVELMDTHHIPGAAISVVKDGEIFFAKGYGYADLESGTPVTVDRTIFRTGSVSKVFTCWQRNAGELST